MSFSHSFGLYHVFVRADLMLTPILVRLELCPGELQPVLQLSIAHFEHAQHFGVLQHLAIHHHLLLNVGRDHMECGVTGQPGDDILVNVAEELEELLDRLGRLFSFSLNI